MIGLVAQPWWVNLIALIPPLAYFSWRRGGVALSARQLAVSGVFAASFGFLEAVVVVYLRAAVGLLPEYKGTLSDVMQMSEEFYRQSQAIGQLPPSLLSLEVLREAATIYAPQRCFADVDEVQSAHCNFPLDLCHLGYHLLCRALDHSAMAPFAKRSGCVVPDSRAVAFTSVVSAPGEHSSALRGPPFARHYNEHLIAA